MKQLLLKSLIVLILSFSSVQLSIAQLRFPNGTVLNLNTSINFLYFETEILFYTEPMTVDNYKWEKISDSVDTRWLIGSCFNGDCWNGLPAEGTFIKSFGINDTTGFIRFHVETYDTNGKSVIKYRVFNKNNPAEQAELTFNITFQKELGINDYKSKYQHISIFQNSSDQTISIHFNQTEKINNCRIIDINGKIIRDIREMSNDILINNIPKGIYIIELKTTDHLYRNKFLSY
jgi:hypothetical protein